MSKVMLNRSIIQPRGFKRSEIYFRSDSVVVFGEIGDSKFKVTTKVQGEETVHGSFSTSLYTVNLNTGLIYQQDREKFQAQVRLYPEHASIIEDIIIVSLINHQSTGDEILKGLKLNKYTVPENCKLIRNYLGGWNYTLDGHIHNVGDFVEFCSAAHK